MNVQHYGMWNLYFFWCLFVILSLVKLLNNLTFCFFYLTNSPIVLMTDENVAHCLHQTIFN